MAFRGDAREEILSGSNVGDTFRSVFRMGGGWGNFSGPGLFMFRMLISGTLTAAATGMVACMVPALLVGTAGLPFLVGSCAGFVLGSVSFYRDSLRKALISLDSYPLLLRLHLHANFPSEGFNRWGIGRLRTEPFASRWTLQSMLIASWLTAAPALDRILELEEEVLVAESAQKEE